MPFIGSIHWNVVAHCYLDTGAYIDLFDLGFSSYLEALDTLLPRKRKGKLTGWELEGDVPIDAIWATYP